MGTLKHSGSSLPGQDGTRVCHRTRPLRQPGTGPEADREPGPVPVHAITPQQAARTWMGRVGWKRLRWAAPALQQGSADGRGVRMVSGRGVEWAIELGQGDTFHTHYCDMSSACKVRRGKCEVLVGGSRSRPAVAGWELIPSAEAGHSGGFWMPKGSLHTVP